MWFADSAIIGSVIGLIVDNRQTSCFDHSTLRICSELSSANNRDPELTKRYLVPGQYLLNTKSRNKMYLEEIDFTFGDAFNDDLLFDSSPAESLINFELPSNFTRDTTEWNRSDSNDIKMNISVSDEKDSTVFEDIPNLFDFADLENSVDFDSLFENYGINSLASLPSESECADDSDDAFGRLSVLGIDLDTTSPRTGSETILQVDHDYQCLNPEPEAESVKSQWGEPSFCAEYQAFRCPVQDCGKLYAKASHVRAHLRRHSGEKPYRCTWNGCAWKFARSDELARHRRSHSGDKPYRCQQCEKRFARSDHLAKHARVHARRAAAATAARKLHFPQSNRGRRLYVTKK